jgi:hypothetical protein
VNGNRRFEETYGLYLQGSAVSQARNHHEAGSKVSRLVNSSTLKMEATCSPKCRLTLTGLHSVISQKTDLFRTYVGVIQYFLHDTKLAQTGIKIQINGSSANLRIKASWKAIFFQNDIVSGIPPYSHFDLPFSGFLYCTFIWRLPTLQSARITWRQVLFVWL